MTLVIYPIVLSDTYNLSELVIGLWYIPVGVGAMLGSHFGGKVTDFIVKKLKVPEGNWGGVMVGVMIEVTGFLIFGWVSEVIIESIFCDILKELYIANKIVFEILLQHCSRRSVIVCYNVVIESPILYHIFVLHSNIH
jgi:hypothetical protein